MIHLLSCLLLAALTQAAPKLESRQNKSCNTASNRACWLTGYNISTDYEVETPPGTSVHYNFTITEETNWVAPDGSVRDYVQLVNGQFPGPTLFANWGDNITVTVTNTLPTNGTTIHWHGVRQLNNNINDGVNGVTECPLAPGKTKTYNFLAEQYGTSWYHSHHSGQYADGAWGAIQIEGPASDNYDIDLGTFPVGDWYYKTVDKLTVDLRTQVPPPSDNIFFNGTNINPADPTQGEYAVVTLTPGLRHRLRVINPSADNEFQLSLVGHQFTVIATDFVPIDSFTTDNIFVGIGQRYDILIDASADVDNYWFNATLTGNCGTSNNLYPAAIFRYEGAPDALPTEQGTAPADAGCLDRTNFTPVVTRQLDSTTIIGQNEVNISSPFVAPITWYVDLSAIDVEWDKPVLEYVIEGNTSYPATENLYFVDGVDEWTYWVVQNLSPAPHPMHLHGHDFLVLGNSGQIGGVDNAAIFSSSDSTSLNFNNPTRRDVTMIPANGWTVVAFKSDNPGNWLFHCHIAWHVGEGLSMDFMERRDDQLALISAEQKAAYEQVCTDWKAWEQNPLYTPQPDSGI